MITEQIAVKKSLAATLSLALLFPSTGFAQVIRVAVVQTPINVPAVVAGKAASTLMPLTSLPLTSPLFGAPSAISAPVMAASQRGPAASVIPVIKVGPAASARANVVAFAKAMGDTKHAGLRTSMLFENSKLQAEDGDGVAAEGMDQQMPAEAVKLHKAYEERDAKRKAALQAEISKVKSGRFSLALVVMTNEAGQTAIGVGVVVGKEAMVLDDVEAMVAAGKAPAAEWAKAKAVLAPAMQKLEKKLAVVLQTSEKEHAEVHRQMDKIAGKIALKKSPERYRDLLPESVAAIKAFEARAKKRLEDLEAEIAKVKFGRFGLMIMPQPTGDGRVAIMLGIVVDGQAMSPQEVEAYVAAGAIAKAEWEAVKDKLVAAGMKLVKKFGEALKATSEENEATRDQVMDLENKPVVALVRTVVDGIPSLKLGPAAKKATFSPAVIQKEMIKTLDQIAAIFSQQYAPLEWKQKQFQVDLKRERNKVRAAIMADPEITTQKFQNLLYGLTAAMRDYHVSIRFNSTESAKLPLSIIQAGGKYFIGYVDRSKLSVAKFPYQEGDEVTQFDGQPTADAVRAIAAAKGPNVEETDLRLAETFLTNRRRVRGDTVPHGDVSMVIRRGDGAPKKVTLTWDYTPELVAQDVPLRDAGGLFSDETAVAGRALGDKKSTNDILNPDAGMLRHMIKRVLNGVKDSASAAKTSVQDTVSGLGAKIEMAMHPLTDLFAVMRRGSEDNPFMLEARKSYVPALGDIVWQTEDKDLFHAYIFKTADGSKHGFIRIPSYMAGKDEVERFGEIMAKFQAETDSLVIDQVNNPGGSVPYLYALVSHLTDKPMKTPLHHLLINASDAQRAADFLLGLLKPQKDQQHDPDDKDAGTIGGYPITRKVLMELVRQSQFILKEFKEGKRFTDLTAISAVNEIDPAADPAQRYTKPVLLLTNALDFSGGDFFPAIMQDNKRATILGVGTAGAGGYVKSIELPNQFGIESLHVTGSIAERTSGQPIENLGVMPDIKYELTEKDMRTAFAEYRYAILKAFRELSTPRSTRGK